MSFFETVRNFLKSTWEENFGSFQYSSQLANDHVANLASLENENTITDIATNIGMEEIVIGELFDENGRDMNDPYINPGVDIVVDESYHGIDHGLGIANPDHEDDMSSYEGDNGVNDLFAGSFDGDMNDFGGGTNDF